MRGAGLLIMCVLSLSACDWFVDADQRVARAEQRVAAGDDRAALIELQNAVRSEPANIRARLMLADVSLRLADPKAAEKELTEAVKHGATADQVAELSAKVRLALGEYQQLLDQLDSRQLALVEPAASTYRGLALLGLNKPDEARQAFEQALAVDPKWERARIGIAEALAAQGSFDASLKELDALLAANEGSAAAWILKGTILSKRGDFRQAKQALEAARKHAPGQLTISQSVALLAMLTETQLASGDLQTAKATHAELAKRVPSSPISFLLGARLAMVQQEYSTAATEAQKAVTAAPDLIPAKLLLGTALLAQGNLNQAETQLSEVVRLAPENMEARKMLARVNLQLQRPDIAMQVLAPAQQTDVADPQLDALLGWTYLQRGDHGAAIDLLERSAAAQPENQNLKLDLAMAYIGGGSNEKAVELLRALPEMPGSSRRENLLITALAASKGIEVARTELDRIVATNPQDAAVLQLAGTLYARFGEFDRARELLSRATKTQPKSAPILLDLARVEMAAGDPKAAAVAIEQALVAEPSNMQARLAHAEIALQSGDTATAVKRLEEARAQQASAVEPRILLGRLYLQQNKTREADVVIREVQAAAQQKPAIANTLGRLYLDAGRFEEALGWFRDAARQDANNPAYPLNVVRAQLALGNNAAANETLRKILEVSPDYVPAAAALAMLDFREGRQEAALQRVAGLKAARPNDPTVAMLEGDLAMAAKSYKEAAQAYATASSLSPSGAAAVRGYQAKQLGGLPDATAPLEAWLQRRPQDVAARMILAEAYVKQGQRERAVEQYELAVRSERPNAMALNNLAWLYHENGDKRALEVAKRANAASPDVPAIADTYGWILVSQGKVNEALPILQKAAAGPKAHPDIRYHYAAALAQSGQRDAARKELLALTGGEAQFANAAAARKLLSQLNGAAP
jgi:putative PEP-CTERM system TPR-repeat lipoprotein